MTYATEDEINDWIETISILHATDPADERAAS